MNKPKKKSIWENGPSKYGTYEGERGSPEQWRAGFTFVWNQKEITRVLKGTSPYTILEISPIASEDEIKSAYRRLVKIHHPDKGGDQREFEKIVAAFVSLTSDHEWVGINPHPSHVTPQPTPSSSSSDNLFIPQLLTELKTEEELEKYLRDDSFGGQEKKDGRHLTLQVRNGKVTTRNKKGVAIDGSLEFGDSLLAIGCDLTIDGEQIGEKFWAWDLLDYNGHDYRTLPYYCSTRMSRYYELKRINFGDNIKILSIAVGYEEKKKLFEEIKAKKKEGIVFKRLLAEYTSGRTEDQFKYKLWATASVIVVKGHEGKASIGMEMIDENGDREFVGYCSCSMYPLPIVGSVAEIKYLYAYRGGCLYQPSFKELRDDVDVDECLMTQLKYKAEED